LRVHLSAKSQNKKTGPIPVSTTERDSCPSSCAWYEKGCYAKYGPLGLHWRKVVERGMTWLAFCKEIAKLPMGQVWRHNQAGDLPGKNKRIAFKALTQLVKANKGKRGFTYTHKPMNVPGNRTAVRYANKNGFVINLSADNLKHADELANLNIAPVCTVLPSDAPLKSFTPEGRHVIVCPAEYRDEVNCGNCQLCGVSGRKSIIGFRAHGTASKTVSSRASLNIVE
jgi:hypothetical protein